MVFQIHEVNILIQFSHICPSSHQNLKKVCKIFCSSTQDVLNFIQSVISDINIIGKMDTSYVNYCSVRQV
jgi:hypothetical protein